MTKEELEQRFASMAKDPEALKQQMRDAARREQPEMTDAQFEAHWQHVSTLFDL